MIRKTQDACMVINKISIACTSPVINMLEWPFKVVTMAEPLFQVINKKVAVCLCKKFNPKDILYNLFSTPKTSSKELNGFYEPYKESRISFIYACQMAFCSANNQEITPNIP